MGDRGREGARRRVRLFELVALAALVASAGTVGYEIGTSQPRDLGPFGLLRRLDYLVETRYLDPQVTRPQLLYGAARGMLETLDDPYSRFMDPQAFKEFQETNLSGHFTGIGIIMDLKDGQVIVVSPIPGTPASRAGLQPGDRITGIEGRPTRDMALQRAVALIRGPSGTVVHLTVDHGGHFEEMALTRGVIHAPSVTGDGALTPEARDELHRLGVAYLRVIMFDETTGEEFRRALEALASAPRGLIIDLRGNGGGLVDSAVSVANEFVPAGPIVTSVDRNGKQTVERATGAARVHVPVVMLVNEYSASASEIVAGALQDDHLATLVGVQTFGKGIVQTIFPLPGGAGAAITTYKYLTPGGRSIHKKGLTPDVIVGTRLEGKSPEEIRRIQDLQLERAIEVLRSRLPRSQIPLGGGSRFHS